MKSVEPWFKELRIQYLSDLHLEGGEPFSVERSGEVLVLAGDCFTGQTPEKFQRFLQETVDLGFKAVFYVLGNHEGYGWTFEQAIDRLRQLDEWIPEFHFLHQTEVTIDGVRFIGCPLWSRPNTNAQIQARLYINDYRAVRGWTIDQHMAAHEVDRAWLAHNVQKGDVIVTHFPPTNNGTDTERYGTPENNPLGSWFVNNMEEEIRRWRPSLWISGHTHHCWDEMVHGCRDVGNCRGYSFRNRSTGQWQNECKGFNPTKTITHKVFDEVVNGSTNGVA